MDHEATEFSNERASVSIPGLPHLFHGSGEMDERMRAFDWGHSALGETQHWPTSLRAAVNLCLSSAFPVVVLWGEDLVQLYNDGYRDLMGARHPAGLGQPTRDCWPEVWAFNEPIYQQVQQLGKTLTFSNQRLVLQRLGYEEEAFFELGYSPVWSEEETVGGVLVTVIEITRLVLAERRLSEKEAEFTRQNTALERFARLTRDHDVSTDAQQLIRGAQEIVLNLLPPGVAVYWELQRETWRVGSQVGELYDPELQALMDAGVPYAAGQRNVIPWESRRPYYRDQHPVPESSAALVPLLHTTASLPIFIEGHVTGIFSLGVFEALSWTAADRAVMETIARVLGEALERGERLREAEEERATMSAFVAFTEQVGTQTDVLDLARRAVEVLSAQFPENTVGYYQQIAGVWKMRVWNTLMPEDVLEIVTTGWSAESPLLNEVLATQQLAFTARWNADEQHVLHSEQYGAAVAYPLILHGKVLGLLTMGVPGHTPQPWVAQDRTLRMVRTIGQSLQLALERGAQVEQLRAHQERLQEANEELTSFSHSVSHDLRTPVRHIVGFAGMLRKTIEPYLEDRSRHQLKVIDTAARQLDEMIDALLNLSRTARLPMQHTLIELPLLVERVKQDTWPDLVGRNVDWRIGALPSMQGDPDLLKQVVGHLISNALKFTQTREETVIQIWAEDQPQEWRIFIQDNGIGFDPKYQGKLFGTFQKLHSSAQFQGTGIGLASVRRIVHRHGGQVWAEGTPDLGATFGFSLPKNVEKQSAIDS